MRKHVIKKIRSSLETIIIYPKPIKQMNHNTQNAKEIVLQ